MRCVCGALLAGLDLVIKRPAAPDADAAPIVPPSGAADEETILCMHEDCGQRSPAGSVSCVYCDRPLAGAVALTPPAQLYTLLNLPASLRQRYRIVQPLPALGAEAELLLVEAIGGGPTLVAKIYRQGIHPKRAVQERLARIDVRHRVEMLEADTSDGYAYELMEYCRHGSWRDRLQAGPLATTLQPDMVSQLAAAIRAVHAAGLVHRDLKPENILLRSVQPLDLLLTDFGIASVLEATQRFTGTARTLQYAAPESLSGVIDGKADYWALGMIVLEGALGSHPFAGLSEAVILHHLTTRNIDLSGIGDSNIRKLLRGLLQRNPALRWGDAELLRWLANDPALAEPVEHGSGSGFSQPYHIGLHVCHSPQQLAVALAQHWQEACADILNGQLLAWFRDVQKDQNVVRLMLALRYDRELAVDLQLLKLILHLAPGIPLIWRGESIRLADILGRANLALKGDLEAGRWLDALYQQQVLEIYAATGNQEAGTLVQRWTQACRQFSEAWKSKRALISSKDSTRQEEYANFDVLIYGGNSQDHAPLSSMHAQLLAMAYDVKWGERLRQRLVAELASLSVHCPWIASLGDPQVLDGASLLVIEALLPQARKAAERQLKANERQREQDVLECQQYRDQYNMLLASLRNDGRGRVSPEACARMRQELERYFELIARARASGRTDLPWQDMTRALGRIIKTANQLLQLIDELTERRAVNRGWFSREALGFGMLGLFLLPIMFGARLTYPLMAGLAGAAAWRLLPNLMLARQIKAMAQRL